MLVSSPKPACGAITLFATTRSRFFLKFFSGVINEIFRFSANPTRILFFLSSPRDFSKIPPSPKSPVAKPAWEKLFQTLVHKSFHALVCVTDYVTTECPLRCPKQRRRPCPCQLLVLPSLIYSLELVHPDSVQKPFPIHEYFTLA